MGRTRLLGIFKAAALALRKIPQCNSSWTDDCIAMQTENGEGVCKTALNKFVEPFTTGQTAYCIMSIYLDSRTQTRKVFLQLEKKFGYGLKNKREELKNQKIMREEHFTVSNLGGPFGIKQLCAVVNPPQATIVAVTVGSVEKRHVPGSGPDEFNFASYMPVTLSCDHGVVDYRAIGAEWLRDIKGYIENPEYMLL